ncbi:MAG: AI-2E family transporter [Candidatus Limiplasma sp.]|nr:AI-2E family transporter [Candidatus Limiplasma sp.]
MHTARGAPIRKRIWQGALLLILALAAVWARALLWQAVLQLFFGMLAAMAALPVMRLLERRLPPGLSASLSMLAVTAGLVGALLLLVPFVLEQARQLMGMLPLFYAQMSHWMQQAESWLAENGIGLGEELKASLLENGQTLLTDVVPATMAQAGNLLDGLSKLLLAPAFAFYFLRDRKSIGGWLLLTLPVHSREMAVRLLREMRRELAGFLRGQLMVSAVVGSLTGLGLLLVGLPNWPLLGTVMGVLELIPYVGPFLGGVLVVLFALQGGLPQTLWALGVVVVVQQLEGGMLSPKLMGDATRLHPVLVLLAVMVGGLAGGIMGILLSLPVALCARAALRVISLHAQSPEVSGNEIFSQIQPREGEGASKKKRYGV